jgi:xylulokinase
MALHLGIDMGTSSLKAAVIDDEGRLCARSRIPARVVRPKDDWYEVAPTETWRNGVVALCRDLETRIPLSEVSSLCVSSLCGTFVPVDAEFRPVYNAILYGIDRRSTEQVARLNRHFGTKRLAEVLGGPFTTHSVIPKILWLKEECPDIYARTRYFLESNNFATAWLTGIARWDYPSAAGTGLVDLRTCARPDTILAEAGLDPERLPPLAWPLDRLGSVTREAADATGLREGTVVMTGGCDINAEVMASWGFRPGRMTVSFGSTLALLLTTDTPVRVPGFVAGMSLVPGTWRVGAATSSGAKFLEWVGRLTGVAQPEARTRPTGIVMLPYLEGARTPFHAPGATCTVTGLTGTSEPWDIAWAAREALGYELSMLLEAISRKTPTPDTLEAGGGLAHVPEFMRLVADITGRRLRLHPDTDASFGDALVALSADVPLDRMDALPGIAEHLGKLDTVDPDPDRHEAYAPHRSRFVGMCRTMFPGYGI